MRRNTCEINVGRLVEICVAKGYETVADVDEMIGMLRARVSTLPANVRHVTAADWRACQLMHPAASERARQMLQGANPRTHRSAVIVSTSSPTAVMQVLRLISEADNSNRRLFTDPLEMALWLGEVLNTEEVARLREFLGVHP